MGTLLGAYEVIGTLGAGGMGEVYRARDRRLDRDVAIKVLPRNVATDPERLARFTREAKTLAALNHPNIAHIYEMTSDAGSGGGATSALVMELVEGEDLSAMIARHALPVRESLTIARQIADALEAAHEQGIIHRDLKPANIKVRNDGLVKVLDFGLAKAFYPQGAKATTGVMDSPTVTAATQLGVILGTAAYMAPEQARGKGIDKRADIWAFGCVLYEMLTARRVFKGHEISDVLAAVLRQDIDWTALPSDTPPRLRRLLERCLDRDMKTRLRDIGEARVELATIEGGASDATSGTIGLVPSATRTTAHRMRELVAWTIASAAVVAAGSMFLSRASTAPAATAQTVILPFVPPSNVVPGDVNYVTISPDGTKILFSAFSRDGHRALWVRPLDSVEATPLPDSDDAIEPFWSPDSKSVAFGSRGKLRRIDLGAGRATVLCDATRSNNGAWSPAGVIVFSPDYRTALVKVSATGGTPTPAATLNAAVGDTGHRYPTFLPDGRHFLFRSDRGGKTGIVAASIDSKETKDIPIETTGGVQFVPPDFLIYVRNGSVVSQRFDPDRLEVSGEPATIAPASTEANYALGARVSASHNGVLVIQNPVAYRLSARDIRPQRQTRRRAGHDAHARHGRRVSADFAGWHTRGRSAVRFQGTEPGSLDRRSRRRSVRSVHDESCAGADAALDARRPQPADHDMARCERWRHLSAPDRGRRGAVGDRGHNLSR